MPDQTKPAPTDLPPGVPRRPSKAEVDQVSRDQALITDEWAPSPPHPEQPDNAKP